MDLLMKLLRVLEHSREIEIDASVLFFLLCATAIFGIMNCFLGYRLMRFWMMVGGILFGAILGYILAEPLHIPTQNRIILFSAACGVVLGILAFLVYKAGIFAFGVGIGLSVSIYIFHPTTSAIFFVCLLCGLILGILTLKYAKVVIIFSTGIVGGILAGMSLQKLLILPLFPHGVGTCAGLTCVGILIQFLTNPKKKDDIEEGPDLQEFDSVEDDFEKED